MALAMVKFLMHYLLYNSSYDLQRDEYLYLDQANHMAWGFMEVPPALSLQAYLTLLMGNGLFWIKFWPVVCGALTVLVTGRIVLELGGGLFAQALACLSVIVSAYMRLNMLFQPNSLEVLLWTTSFLLLVRYIHTQKPACLLWLGVLFGLGLLNKYSAVFFIVGTLVGLLLTPYRTLLWNKTLYLAALITFVLFLPNLLWQLTHNIPFLYHMALLSKHQLQHVQTSDFLKDQLLMCFPVLFVWTVGLVAIFVVKSLRKYLLVGIIYLTVMGILIIFHGKNYYTLGLYPVLLAFGSLVWERSTKQGWQYWLRPALLIIPLALLIPLFPLLYPIWSPEKTEVFARNFKELGLLRWEDGKDHPLPQDYADMLGWQELAEKVAATYQKLPEPERKQTIIVCANYGQAGAINYYGQKYHLPQAYSTEASYLLWIPDEPPFKNIIIVDDEPDPIEAHFKYYKEESRIENPYAREKDTQIVLALDADNAIKKAFYLEIKEKKRPFGL